MKPILKIITLFLFCHLGNISWAQVQELVCEGQLFNSISISTGVDEEGNSIIPNIGAIDPYWVLINQPVLSRCSQTELQTLGTNAYVVNFNNFGATSWTNQDGVGTISPVSASDGILNCSNPTDSLGMTRIDPFIFDRYFCLDQGAEIEFDISFKGDDRLSLAIVNLNTGVEEQVSTVYTYQNPPLVPATFSGAIGLEAGSYALRAYYENFAVAGGFSVKGSIRVINGSELLQQAKTIGFEDCSRQDTLATDDYYYYPDSSLTICIDKSLLPAATAYQYQWFAPDGTPLNITPANDQECYTISNLNEKTVGTYFCQVQVQGSDVCYLLPVKVETYVQDPTGAWYIPNQLVVKYRNNVTEAQKLAYINKIQATRLDSCMCLIDLLVLPDTLYDENGDPIIDPEEKKKKAGSENNTGVETVGWNTIMEEETLAKNRRNQRMEDWQPLPPEEVTTNGDSVIVALIDTGFDYKNPAFSPYIWNNPDPYPLSSDSCKTCIVGAEQGYDFGDGDNDPTAENPHGDFVGRSILYMADLLAGQNSPKVRIMPLKVMDKKSQITVFNVTCATVFAVRHGAQVINYSMGGYGGYQDILAAGINTREEGDCLPAIVTSAGNDSIDISVLPHYFSNLRDSLPEVITVNAYQTNPNDTYEMAPYSNYGNNVDLTITGEALYDTYPYTDVAGTSISAGYVSGVLAYIYEQKPGVSAGSAVSALQNLASQNAGGLNLVSITGLYWQPGLDRILEELPTENCSYTNQACIPIVTNTRQEYRGKLPLKINVVPNPNPGDWEFQFSLGQSQRINIFIFDVQGKLVKQDNFQKGSGLHRISYSLGNQPNGIYFYQVISEKYIHAGKIIKKGE